jgi:hypothetical protein
MRNRKSTRYFALLLLLAASVTLFGCDSTETVLERSKDPILRNQYPIDNEDQVTISQGVWGNVCLWEGDFMPPAPYSGTIIPVRRTVYAFEPTHFDSVVAGPSAAFYAEILTQVVDSTYSNGTGFFQMELAPGKYSFFVKECFHYYANSGDGMGFIQTATVYEDSVTKIQIDITHNATY